MMYYEILNDQGEVVNTIIAPLSFVEEHYFGRFRQIEAPVFETAPPEKDVRQLLEALGQVVLPKLIIAEELTDEQIDGLTDLFMEWKPGQVVKVDDWRRHGGKLYRCVQAHTTQSDWTPDIVPALWQVKAAPGVIAAWVQPTGAHDAYNIGDRVTHVGKTWQSTINANTTVPGQNLAHGYWVEVAN
jgi:hypothetical protein